jgi:hypothetical protein
VWPDFGGGSIVNLMNDVVRSRGGRAAGVGMGDRLDSDITQAWQRAPSVVLLVLDGVGMTQLALLPEDAFLRRQQRGVLTSVFPSTTATAITTFMTARTPAAHGLTGWHVRAVEAGLDGCVLAILPVTLRGGGDLPLSQNEVLARMCRAPAMFRTLPGPSQVISPADIAHSPFNTRHSEGAVRVAYRGLDGLLDALTAALSEPDPPAYIYAYWPDFDHCAHTRGCASDPARALLCEVDRALAGWADTPAARRAALLVTADHGFIDAPADRLLELESFPELADCVQGPLSGERRAVFCHLKPGRSRDFERALHAIEHACVPWSSADLLRDGRFGPGEAHLQLRARIGDYTLEMKDDWTLRDTVDGERPFRLIGVHGGTSAAEMRVPLAVLPPR